MSVETLKIHHPPHIKTYKTSNQKVIDFAKAARQRGKRDTKRRTEDGSKRGS